MMGKTLVQKISIIFIAAISVSILCLALTLNGQVSALSGSEFKADRITDDGIFYNGNSLTVDQIQNFLNSKMPACDTHGQKMYNSTQTRAQWAEANGKPLPPYICLKDHKQGHDMKSDSGLCGHIAAKTSRSAAQIIDDVARACNVSQRALVVMLQKEQSLVTDDWPWPVQYEKAMGYYCPDDPNNPGWCHPDYAGFFNQVYNAALQFNRYKQYPEDYNHAVYRSSYVAYQANAPGCGGTNLTMQSAATAGLYNYTPYQPNAAALNNLYGTGDNCSAYGNRNFWRMHNDWFGPTINDAYLWEVVQEDSTGKMYLIVNRSKHYIPGPSILNAWGLNNVPARGVDSTYLNNFVAGASLDYVGLDIHGNRYLMNQGKKYLLSSDQYVLAWGLAGVPHISAPGYVAQTALGGNAGRFVMTSTGTPYLLNGISKHAGINSASLSHWGQTSSNTTVASADIVDRLPTGVSVDHFVNSGKSYMVDEGSVLNFLNTNVEHAWIKANPPAIAGYALSRYLMPWKNVGTFVLKNGESQWQYLQSNTLHPITSPAKAAIWGWGSSNPLTVISADLYGEYTSGAPLSYVASSTATGRHYIIGKSKHWVTGPSLAATWEGSSSPVAVSEQSLGLLPSGKDINTMNVGFHGHPHLYSVDEGVLRHIPGPTILNAMGGYDSKPVIDLDSNILSILAKGTAIDITLRDSSTSTTHYLERGNKYTLDNTYLSTWGASSAPNVSSSLLNLLTSTGKTLDYKVEHGGRKYLISDRGAIDVTGDFDNYGSAASDFVTINKMYFRTNASSHLIGTPGNNKIWLLSNGKRYHIKNGALLSDLGYGRHSHITTVSNSVINTLPEQIEPATRLIRANDTGALFVISGNGYGFKDSKTLTGYVGPGHVQIVPRSVFNKFGFHGWTSQLIYGTDGKVYAVEDGKKRWVTGPSVMHAKYPGIDWWQVPQHVVNDFPTGENVTN